jgi:hypothetical protein
MMGTLKWGSVELGKWNIEKSCDGVVFNVKLIQVYYQV